MSDRYVLVRVTDPRVDFVDVSFVVHPSGQGIDSNDYLFGSERIPVPEDNQLRKDLEYAADALMSRATRHFELGQTVAAEKIRARSVRLRAAAGLDQEDE